MEINVIFFKSIRHLLGFHEGSTVHKHSSAQAEIWDVVPTRQNSQMGRTQRTDNARWLGSRIKQQSEVPPI